MGRKSTNPHKSIYFEAREKSNGGKGMTRAEASEALNGISESRLEKLETGKTTLQPEDVVDMARVYNRPDLCNYYCRHDCAIGADSVPEAREIALPEIALGMLSSLNTLDSYKNRLIEIAADGKISEDEKKDFNEIKKQLENIDIVVESLKLWVAKNLND